MGEQILWFLSKGFEFWNSQTAIVMELLTTSPENFKGGGAWKLISYINPIFVGVGSGLIVLFFIIGLCEESIDIRDNAKLETIIKSLIKLCLSGWLVANNLFIVKTFFEVVGNLILAMMNSLGDIGANSDVIANMKINEQAAETIKGLNGYESLIFLIVAMIIFIIVVVCSFAMLYAVYFRFLRVLLIVPFGALTFSTYAGNHSIDISKSYFKFAISVSLEAVVMVLAIVICNAFVSSGVTTVTTDYADWAQVIIYLCEITFSIALTVASVKGAQSFAEKIIR